MSGFSGLPFNLAPDGTVALPAFSFVLDPDTGLYRIGANNVGVAVNGAKVLDLGTTGVGIVGDASLSTGGFKNTMRSVTAAHFDTSSAAVFTVATGASNAAITPGVGAHMICVIETTTTGQAAIYICAGGTIPVLVAAAAGGIWVTPNATLPTPSAGQSTLGFSGSVYGIYHNQTGAKDYRVMDFRF